MSLEITKVVGRQEENQERVDVLGAEVGPFSRTRPCSVGKVLQKSQEVEPLQGRAVSGDLEESLLCELRGGSLRAVGRGVNGCGGNGESECRLLFWEAWLGRKDSVIKEGGREVEGGCTELSSFLDEM